MRKRMKLKPITAIIVLLLVVAALLIAGCTTSPTSTTNQTSSTATHNATLEKFVEEYKNNSDKNATVRAWEVTWINDTAVRIQFALHNKSTNMTLSGDTTVLVLPTTQDATNYLNAMNKTEYTLASTTYPSGGTYQKATGHAPQTYKSYEWVEGSAFDISAFRLHLIEQADNIILTSTGRYLSS